MRTPSRISTHVPSFPKKAKAGYARGSMRMSRCAFHLSCTAASTRSGWSTTSVSTPAWRAKAGDSHTARNAALASSQSLPT